MLDWLSLVQVLAQDAPKQAAEKAAEQGPGGLGSMLIPMVAIGFLWYFLLLRPQLGEQKKRKQLVENIKKNDKVISIGGIIGTVTNLSTDGKEVTLRVDDNTKIKMLRSSIQTVVVPEDNTDS